VKLTDLRGILHYIPQFREKTFILALDGNIVTDDNFPTLLLDVALLWSLNIRVVLVHGAAAQIQALARARKVQPSDTEGTGITDAATLQLAIDAATRLTHEILEGLSANDLRARAPTAWRRIRWASSAASITSSPAKSRRWTSRDSVDAQPGSRPCRAPARFDGDGNTYRVNSDSVAVALAEQLKATKLIFVTSRPGPDVRRPADPPDAGDGSGQARPAERRSAGSGDGLQGETRHRRLHGGVPRVHVINGTQEKGCSAKCSRTTASGRSIYANEYENIRPARKRMCVRSSC
jgi:amino-acid N-acetyltransferase